MASGLVVRLLWINALGFNSDEAVYAGQAASIAGNTDLFPYFPIFRAHPLLFQTILSLFYQDGVSDVVGRYVSVGFGMATVLLSYLIGKELYGRPVGNLTALIVALMPYQVVVTRQVLLDGPMVTFSALTLYLVAKYASTRRDLWLVGAGAALGLTSITKETGALLIGSIFAFLALSQHLGTRLRTALAALAAWYVVFLPYPLSLSLSGESTTGRNFLAWQLFRRPNHTWDFYAQVVPPALGWGVVVFAVVALALAARSGWLWRETLLLCWVAVPVVIFEVWPVKGFQYLLPISVPMAVLAAAGLVALFRARGRWRRTLAAFLVVGVVLSCLVPTVLRIKPSDSPVFLAGSGGVPGGRETGDWIATHVPEGAQILTLGPSMANIVEFYGRRQAYGLSVSTNPLNRNPVYVPIDNPDLSIRRNQIQYIVWDAYSAARSPFFSSHLLRYAERYHGRVVHTETVQVKSPDGSSVAKPVIIVYEVRP
jgi:4-amino-4-deoxy-L-arabinose transferase-like glycosyltransferase